MRAFNLAQAEDLSRAYGSPLYVFDEQAFVDNFRHLERAFRSVYPKYRIAYSFKTNYTPYIVSVVKKLGGYAEVVSGMEYFIAKKMGFPDREIIFNGPNKGQAGMQAFLNGCMVNVDNMQEASELVHLALDNRDRKFEIALRVNMDVGQNFISRFGIDPSQLEEVLAVLHKAENISVVGLHCHISRCRGLQAWQQRAEQMLAFADRYFAEPPKFIDLGSGMFGTMDAELEAQFSDVPSYEDYAGTVAGAFARHYHYLPEEKKPTLITEPGTTLVNRFVDFIARVDAIKTIREKNIAVLNCSEHNLGETCTLKELPLRILPIEAMHREYAKLDFTGYTCLEQDVMRKDLTCSLAVGDYVIFGNVGGYSNVLKPPFIWPNCAMVALAGDGQVKLMKEKESFEDILHTYVF